VDEDFWDFPSAKATRYQSLLKNLIRH